MKKLLSAVSATLLLTSCEQLAKLPEAAAPARHPPLAAAPVAADKILTSGDTWPSTSHDTLQVRGGTISIRPATRAEWNRAPAPTLSLRPDSLESRALAQTDGRVRREGIQLLLEPFNGGLIGIVNDTADTDAAAYYHYWGALPAAHQWVLFIGLYEGSAVALIDQRSGRRTNVWGRPVPSPDGRYLLVSSADLAAAYDPNGLQLFRIEATGPRLVWQYSLNSWAPEEVRWLDNQNILVKQAAGPGGEEGEAKSGYARLTLPQLL